MIPMKTSSLDILENAGLPTALAHAMLKTMESEMTSAHEALATKADLLAGLSALRGELVERLVGVHEKIGGVEGKMGGIEGRLTRWVFTCILGQTAVLAGLGYFLLRAGK